VKYNDKITVKKGVKESANLAIKNEMKAKNRNNFTI